MLSLWRGHLRAMGFSILRQDAAGRRGIWYSEAGQFSACLLHFGLTDERFHLRL